MEDFRSSINQIVESAKLYEMIEINEAVCISQVHDVCPNDGNKFSLKELQEFVGGYIEFVYLKDGRLAVANEEGVLLGLPFNMLASMEIGQSVCGNILIAPRCMFD